MNAADRNRIREFVDGLTPTFLRVSFIIMTAIALLGWTYHAGHARGVADVRHATIDSEIKVQRDTIREVETRYVTDTIRVTVTKHAAASAVASFDSAARVIEAVADTASLIPASLVLPEIRACKTALTADSLAYAAQAVALADMTIDRNAQRTRAELDEQNTPHVPRFGIRTGLALGAGLALAVLHLLH